MIRRRDAKSVGQLIPGADVFEAVDHGGQVVVEESTAFGGQEIGHDQDTGSDAGVTQDGAFLDIADGEPAGAARDQTSRDLDGAMAVGVGFDDGHDLDAGPDDPPDRFEIACNLAERDLDPRAEGEGSHTSIVSGLASGGRFNRHRRLVVWQCYEWPESGSGNYGNLGASPRDDSVLPRLRNQVVWLSGRNSHDELR